MLPGKARAGQILGGGRAADGNRDAIPAFPFERAIGRSDLIAQRGIVRCVIDDAPSRGRTLGEQRQIVMVERHQASQLAPGAGRAERVAISPRGHCKTVGHPHALRAQHRI